MSHWKVIGLFKAALKQPDWIDDKVEDQFPRMTTRSGPGIRLPQMDSGSSHNNANQGKKRGLSKSIRDEPERASSKRQKAAER